MFSFPEDLGKMTYVKETFEKKNIPDLHCATKQVTQTHLNLTKFQEAF